MATDQDEIDDIISWTRVVQADQTFASPVVADEIPPIRSVHYSTSPFTRTFDCLEEFVIALLMRLFGHNCTTASWDKYFIKLLNDKDRVEIMDNHAGSTCSRYRRCRRSPWWPVSHFSVTTQFDVRFVEPSPETCQVLCHTGLLQATHQCWYRWRCHEYTGTADLNPSFHKKQMLMKCVDLSYLCGVSSSYCERIKSIIQALLTLILSCFHYVLG